MNGVAVINRADALVRTSQSLGLAIDGVGELSLSRALIAQSLRRAVFNASPCAVPALRALVFAALSPLTDDADGLKVRIEDTLDDLIAIGDILEMRTDADGRRDVVLRPAPPAFIVRRDGTFIILGIAGDEITPVLRHSVFHHESGLRSLRAEGAEACRSELLDAGLLELPERLWLFAPPVMSASDLVARWHARLPADARPEKMNDFEILDLNASKSFYKNRWSALNVRHAGIFVARRRQRFGAKLWCLADVRDGVVQRFTDVRAKDSRARDCDEAWRLQAAMDAVAGTPQSVRVSERGDVTILAFSAPLPAWASRRLSFIGTQTVAPRALLAFEVPTKNTQDELRWLGENIWLVRNYEGIVA